MRTRNRNRLALFVLVSLALHAAAHLAVARMDLFGSESAKPLVAIPFLRAPSQLEPQQQKPLPSTPAEVQPGTQRFRPTEEHAEAKKTPANNPSLHEAVKRSEQPESASIPMDAKAQEQYRRKLLVNFKPDWQKVPDLIVIADSRTQQEVSRFFGMTLIAYPKGTDKPDYVILIEEDSNTCKFTRDFDFSRFSNRVKDRSNVPEYKRLVRLAKKRLALPEELAIVSLVPAAADAYFAAKQMQAAKLAGLQADGVVRTEGHYALDRQDRYCLIIDRVITSDGREIHIDDPERGAVRLQ